MKDLKNRTLHATRWAAILSLVMQAGRMVVHFVLAWMLGPETFGLAARVLAVGNIMDMAAELGFIAAVIQRQDLTERHLRTAFSANLLCGLLVGALGFFGLWGYEAWFGVSDFTRILVGVTPLPVVMALGHVPQALMTRDLDFRSQAVANAWGTLAYIGVAVALGAAGAGAWGVLAGYYANFLVLAALLWRRSSWRPAVGVYKKEFRELFGFGSYHALSKFLNALTRGLDVLLIGWRLGNAAAGLYSVGIRVGALAVGQVGNVLNSVMFASFSRIQDDRARLADAYLRSTRYMAIVSSAFVVVAYALVPALPLVIGGAWEEAVPVARILCFFAFWNGAGGTLVPPVLSALGRSDHSFYAGVLRTLFQVVFLAVGMVFGLRCAAWSVVAFQIASNLAAQAFVTRDLHVSMWSYIRAVSESLMGVLVAVGVVHALEAAVVVSGWEVLARAVFVSLIAEAAFLATVHALHRRVLAEVGHILVGIIGARSSSPSGPVHY